MKEVRKKSADPAVNQLLVKAFRQGAALAWDRAEAMQPQCGFSRLSLCCSDCHEGPCRINPFGADDQRTICGRDRFELVAGAFLRQVADGAGALARLGERFGASAGYAGPEPMDAMLVPEDFAAAVAAAGTAAGTALAAIAAARDAAYGTAAPDVTAVNLGVLKADAVNVVLHGHVPPAAVKLLAAAAAAAEAPVNIAVMCGSETTGDIALPVLTNYDSQEAVLFTGAVDLLVRGSQCVMPAMVKMAAAAGVPVVSACAVADAASAAAAISQGVAAFRQRAGRTAPIPDVSEPLYTGYTAANAKEALDALRAAWAAGRAAGLAYVGGCGNLGFTQDAAAVKTALSLIKRGYLVVTAGCAGAALAKAGLCQPDAAGANAALEAALPDNLPPVLHLGACTDAGRFLAMAEMVRAAGVPVLAAFPEFAHNKTLATAAAFAAAGVSVFAGLEAVFADAKAASALAGGIPAGKGAPFLPMAALAEAVQPPAEAAKAR